MNDQQTSESWVAALERSIGQITAILANRDFPTGERAVLRRMGPGQPLPLTFYRFAFRYLPDGWERDIQDWITIVAGIALMAPDAHRPEVGFGLALAQAGYAETRLERLLSSRGETRRVLFLRAVRYLVSHTISFNWIQGARLLLIRDPERLELLQRQVARDFYRELHNTAR